MKIIDNFRDNHFFLSNFYPTEFEFDGITYKNSEAAFQAQKVTSKEARRVFGKMLPNEAKKRGRWVNLRSDWESIKDQVMYEVCKAKFSNPALANKLIATGDAILIEGNNHGDTYWGQVNGSGYNKLGQILMKIREEIKAKK